MTLSSSCSNETNSFDSYLSICTDFCPAPHSNHLGGVSEPLYNWSHRTILIHHDHSFFFYLATWQRPPPTFSLQAKYWQVKNAKGKEILSPSSNIFQWLSGSKLECGQLTQSQKILQALGQVAESLQGVVTPWNLSLWAPAFMDQRKGQPQDLWWICGPRIDSGPCPAVTLVSKPWVAWSPTPSSFVSIVLSQPWCMSLRYHCSHMMCGTVMTCECDSLPCRVNHTSSCLQKLTQHLAHGKGLQKERNLRKHHWRAGSRPFWEASEHKLSATNWHLSWVLAIHLYKD